MDHHLHHITTVSFSNFARGARWSASYTVPPPPPGNKHTPLLRTTHKNPQTDKVSHKHTQADSNTQRKKSVIQRDTQKAHKKLHKHTNQLRPFAVYHSSFHTFLPQNNFLHMKEHVIQVLSIQCPIIISTPFSM